MAACVRAASRQPITSACSAGKDGTTLLYMVERRGGVCEVGVLPIVIRWCACSLLLLLRGGLTGAAALSNEPDGCDLPEACFQAAVLPKERLGKGMTKEQVLTIKLERLQRLIDRFPDTVWSKRAGLLSGVLSIDRI